MLTFQSCKEEDIANNPPTIRLIGVQPTTVTEFTDSIVFTIEYEDIDGDIGYPNADSLSLWLLDARLLNPDRFFIPPLAPLDARVHIVGLDSEEISFLMEDNFSYDEELDEDRDVRRKKLAHKEELAKAKNHLEGLKTKYYDEVKAGSKLNPEQQKAVEFFNRYTKENEQATKVAEQQVSTFKNKTEKLFSNDFKGFDFNVGEKKFRFKVNNVDQVKDTQSDINNLVKKFLNDKNEMNDAAGYHKSLFTAMNPDAIANHFYEQGKADAMKSSVEKAKNIDMSPRGAHEKVSMPGGFTVKSIKSSSSPKFGIKRK